MAESKDIIHNSTDDHAALVTLKSTPVAGQFILTPPSSGQHTFDDGDPWSAAESLLLLRPKKVANAKLAEAYPAIPFAADTITPNQRDANVTQVHRENVRDPGSQGHKTVMGEGRRSDPDLLQAIRQLTSTLQEGLGNKTPLHHDINVPSVQRDENVMYVQRDYVTPSQQDINVPTVQRDANVTYVQGDGNWRYVQHDLSVPSVKRDANVTCVQRDYVTPGQHDINVPTVQRDANVARTWRSSNVTSTGRLTISVTR